MRPIATDVARSVVCVSVCVGHMSELCKNGWSDRDAIWGWGLTHVGLRNRVLDGVQIPHGRRHFGGGYLLAHCKVHTHECVAPATGECAYPPINSWVILLTDRLTNKQTCIKQPVAEVISGQTILTKGRIAVLLSPLAVVNGFVWPWPHLMHGSLGPPESGPDQQTHRQAHRQTDHATLSVAIAQILCNACNAA